MSLKITKEGFVKGSRRKLKDLILKYNSGYHCKAEKFLNISFLEKVQFECLSKKW